MLRTFIIFLLFLVSYFSVLGQDVPYYSIDGEEDEEEVKKEKKERAVETSDSDDFKLDIGGYAGINITNPVFDPVLPGDAFETFSETYANAGILFFTSFYDWPMYAGIGFGYNEKGFSLRQRIRDTATSLLTDDLETFTFRLKSFSVPISVKYYFRGNGMPVNAKVNPLSFYGIGGLELNFVQRVLIEYENTLGETGAGYSPNSFQSSETNIFIGVGGEVALRDYVRVFSDIRYSILSSDVEKELFGSGNDVALYLGTLQINAGILVNLY